MATIAPSKKLRWQCRRGMLELDLLLNAYLDTHGDSFSESEQANFIDLLALSDPEIYDFITQPDSVPEHFQAIIHALKK